MTTTALTFDTQTVFTNSFSFETGILAELRQFKGMPVQILVAEIVVQEIERRLVEKSKEALTRLKEATRAAQRYGLVPPQELEIDPLQAQAVAKQRLQKFLSDIGAQILTSESISLSTVMTRYFAQQAPFSATKPKEFPDAISLLALEQWCVANQGRLVVVSGDGDWQRFAEQSECMTWKEKLSDAIEALIGDVALARNKAEYFLNEISRDVALEGEIGPLFHEALADELQSRRFVFEADSSFDQLHLETAEVSLVGFSEDESETKRFTVVRYSETTIAITVPLVIKAEALATFHTEARTLPLATATVRPVFELCASVLATFSGSASVFDVGTVSVDLLLPDPVLINLGNVDNEISESWELNNQ